MVGDNHPSVGDRRVSGGVLLVLAAVVFLPPSPTACVAAAAALALLTRNAVQRGFALAASRSLDVSLACLLGLTALIPRMAYLETVPLVPNVDEGINGHVVLDILEGKGPGLLLEEVYGEEASVFYLMAASWAWLGESLTSLRLPSAIAGALFVALLYLTMRPFAGPAASAAACLLASFDAVHLTYSREANSIAFATTFQALAFFWLWLCLRTGRTGSYAGLGVSLALGLQTYPAFRAVALIALATLAVDAFANVAGRERPFRGPAIAGGLALLSIAPFLMDGGLSSAWFCRLEQVTMLGQPGLSDVGPFLAGLVRVLETLAGGMAAPPLPMLLHPIVAPLALLGAIAFLRQRLELLESWARILWLGALVTAGVAGPVITRLEPQHCRRYLLLLAPLYLLSALGLGTVIRAVFPGRIRTSHALLRLTILVVILGSAAIESGVEYVYSLPPDEPQTRLVSAVTRIREKHPLVLPEQLVRNPFLPRQLAVSPSTSFVIRAYDVGIARGLNPYPPYRRAGELHFALGTPIWNRFIQSFYPGGVLNYLRDPLDPGYSIPVYSVSGRAAWREYGLLLETSHSGGTSREQVAGLRLESRPVAGARSRSWHGAIYLRQAGDWAISVAGEGNPRLAFDGSPMTQAVTGAWHSEGWHSLRVMQGPASTPPRLTWCRPGSRTPVEVPEWKFLISAPAHRPLHALPVARRLYKLQPSGFDIRYDAMPDDTLQDAAVTGERVYELHTGPNTLVCRTITGEQVSDWKGLTDESGRPVSLEGAPDDRAYVLSIAASPGGVLAIGDYRDRRVLFVGSDGRIRRVSRLGTRWPSPHNVSYDPASQEFLACDYEGGRVHRFSQDGSWLGSWHVPGAADVAAPELAGFLYVLVPQRGGIVKVSRSGEEVGFLRAVELNRSSRIACDEQGRLVALAPGRRVKVFSPDGQVLVPLSPGLADEHGVLSCTSVSAAGDGTFLFAVDGLDKGSVQARLLPR